MLNAKMARDSYSKSGSSRSSGRSSSSSGRSSSGGSSSRSSAHSSTRKAGVFRPSVSPTANFSRKPTEFSSKKRRDNPNFKKNEEGKYEFNPPKVKENGITFGSQKEFVPRGKSTRFNVEHNLSGDNPRNFKQTDAPKGGSSYSRNSSAPRSSPSYNSSNESSPRGEYSRNEYRGESRGFSNRNSFSNTGGSHSGFRSSTARSDTRSGEHRRDGERRDSDRRDSFRSTLKSNEGTSVRSDATRSQIRNGFRSEGSFSQRNEGRFEPRTQSDLRNSRDVPLDAPRNSYGGIKAREVSKQAFKQDSIRQDSIKSDSFKQDAPAKQQRDDFVSRDVSPRSHIQSSSPSTYSRDTQSAQNYPANISPTRLQGVFNFRRDFCTKALVPGSIYGERIYDGYRIWDPKRSKLGAGIAKGISQIGIKPGSVVLYLGCSTGTTVSHVSDIIGESGKVYGLDVAPRVMRDFLLSMAPRSNVFPIMADAAHPQDYAHLVEEVDVIFMDIAQRDQVSIFLKNCHAFLKPGGFGLLSLKSRSVDISKSPKQIFMETRAALEEDMVIVDYKELNPFEIDHALFVCKKK
jgi:fibrillarin-like pre-rRNA processing protein